MSLIISSAVAESHANKVVNMIGPQMFDRRTLFDFFIWLDAGIRSAYSSANRVSKAKELIGSVSGDYSYRTIARHPLLLEGYKYTENKTELPEAVKKVLGKLFSNYEGSVDPYSKSDLEDLLDSMITLLGYDVAVKVEYSSQPTDSQGGHLDVCYRGPRTRIQITHSADLLREKLPNLDLFLDEVLAGAHALKPSGKEG